MSCTVYSNLVSLLPYFHWFNKAKVFPFILYFSKLKLTFLCRVTIYRHELFLMFYQAFLNTFFPKTEVCKSQIIKRVASIKNKHYPIIMIILFLLFLSHYLCPNSKIRNLTCSWLSMKSMVTFVRFVSDTKKRSHKFCHISDDKNRSTVIINNLYYDKN